MNCNISKVVRTTRNDLALGTSDGIKFAKMLPGGEIKVTNEKLPIVGKDVTELSEFSVD